MVARRKGELALVMAPLHRQENHPTPIMDVGLKERGARIRLSCVYIYIYIRGCRHGLIYELVRVSGFFPRGLYKAEEDPFLFIPQFPPTRFTRQKRLFRLSVSSSLSLYIRGSSMVPPRPTRITLDALISVRSSWSTAVGRVKYGATGEKSFSN